MTERQRNVLRDLRDCPCRDETWLRPMDVGGRNGSHHSATLLQLCRKGLVEKERRSWLGYSFRYRITGRGRKALADYEAWKKANKEGNENDG